MAKEGVIVRRLNAIENFGSMDVLCTDKTGTLTEGVVRLDGALDLDGQPPRKCSAMPIWNAHFQTGLANPLDEAISLAEGTGSGGSCTKHKVDEMPYDFVRKRLSIVVQEKHEAAHLDYQGCLDNVLEVCTSVQDGEKAMPLDADGWSRSRRFAAWSDQGFRVLGVATKRPVRRTDPIHAEGRVRHDLCGLSVLFRPAQGRCHAGDRRS